MKNPVIVIICLLLFICLPLSGYGQSEIVRKMDELMSECIKMDLFSGTVLVAKDGQILYEKAFGFANKEKSVPNDLKTRFNICSIGKTFTAVLIMQLVESGRLSLTEPIKTYLPEDEVPNSDKITIHHLLTHTSGLFNYMAHPSYAKEKGNLKEIDQVMKLISDQDLVFKIPGEKVSYSNSGFVVLGKIIEKVTGKRYCEYLKERIFIPLGMKNSVLPRVDQEISNKALGYVIGASGKAIVTEEIPAFSDGGIHTTVEDLLKYDQALYGNSLLKDETKELMFAGGHSNLEKYRSGRFDNYSYGWGVKDVNGRRFIGHSGGIRGVNATFARFPNEKYTIIILSNFDRAADELGLKVRALIFGEQYSLPKLPVGRFLFNTIKENGIKKISESPDSILQKNGYQILNDQILNSTGYDLLQNKMPSEALEILKQNVRLFPLCSNCFDSLGEAYMVNGDRRNAIVNYAKSLELDPENKNAVEMLNRLTGK